jgi:GT2 family glycosyltransferase
MTRPVTEKVVVGYLHPGEYSAGFGESLMDLLQYDFATNRRIVEGGGRLSFRAGCNLATPRNEVVRKFLEFGQADWLWMVDSDMTFDPDIVDRLLEYADPVKAPIVGGLCFGFDNNGDIQPTLYGLLGDSDDPEHLEVIRYQEWTPDSMFEVAATGGACLLIHKSVLEAMRDFDNPRGRKGFNDAYPWFQETEHNGKPVGEDITFCWRAIQAGFPVHVNTSVKLGHIKERVLTEQAYFLSRGLLGPTHKGATA